MSNMEEFEKGMKNNVIQFPKNDSDDNEFYDFEDRTPLIENQETAYKMWERAVRTEGLDFRYNERANTIDINIESEWAEASDFIVSHYANDILPEKYYIEGFNLKGHPTKKEYKITINKFVEYMQSYVMDRFVDPFKDWLLELPHYEISKLQCNWLKRPGLPLDNALHMDRILFDLFDQESQEYKTWGLSKEDDYRWHCFFMRNIYMSIIHRTMSPGCKQDIVPILSGEQGAGKDTMFIEMLPRIDGKSLATEDFDFSDQSKESIEKTFGFAMVIGSELAGMRKADNDRLKQFITTKNDNYRVPYDKFKQVIARRFILAGTSNAEHPVPKDSSGSRRYAPVELQQPRAIGPVEEWFAEEIKNPYEPKTTIERRKLFWAEAMAVYRMNPDPRDLRVPDFMREIQEIKCDAYSPAGDTIEGEITEALERHNITKEVPLMLSAVGVLINIIDEPNKTSSIKPIERGAIDHAMRSLGYKKQNLKRINFIQYDKPKQKTVYMHKDSKIFKGEKYDPFDERVVRGNKFVKNQSIVDEELSEKLNRIKEN